MKLDLLYWVHEDKWRQSGSAQAFQVFRRFVSQGKRLNLDFFHSSGIERGDSDRLYQLCVAV